MHLRPGASVILSPGTIATPHDDRLSRDGSLSATPPAFKVTIRSPRLRSKPIETPFSQLEPATCASAAYR